MSRSPRFLFDPTIGRYRDAATGRMVQTSTVRRGIDTVLRASSARVASLTNALRARSIGVEEFEIAMRDEIRLTHTAATIVAKGGRAQMTPADFGALGARLKFQYQRLAAFADGIADGSVPMDGRLLRRADLYAQAPRASFHAVEMEERARLEFDEIRSVLHPADHCATCVSQAGLGWQPIDQMIPIGHRDCLTQCRCTAQFRNSQTGAIAA